MFVFEKNTPVPDGLLLLLHSVDVVDEGRRERKKKKRGWFT